MARGQLVYDIELDKVRSRPLSLSILQGNEAPLQHNYCFINPIKIIKCGIGFLWLRWLTMALRHIRLCWQKSEAGDRKSKMK
jgi:hypothetical protein